MFLLKKIGGQKDGNFKSYHQTVHFNSRDGPSFDHDRPLSGAFYFFSLTHIQQKGGNSSYQPKHADHKYASKINLGNYEHPKLSQQKQNQAEAKERKQDGLFENRKKGKFLLTSS